MNITPEILERAEEYAKSVSKNETYQKYLKDAFLAGYLEKSDLVISGNVIPGEKTEICPVCGKATMVRKLFRSGRNPLYKKSCPACDYFTIKVES